MTPHDLNVVSGDIVSEVLHDPLRHVDPAANNTQLVARSMQCQIDSSSRSMMRSRTSAPISVLPDRRG